MDEGEAFDHNLSEDEKVSADRPRSTGLFRHEMFKTLLHQAKITANMGVTLSTSEVPLTSRDSNTLLFTEAVTEQQAIPSPKLFVDRIQRQWS